LEFHLNLHILKMSQKLIKIIYIKIKQKIIMNNDRIIKERNINIFDLLEMQVLYEHNELYMEYIKITKF